MSLRAFHVFFIVVSTLCCAALAAWSVERVRAADPQGWWLGGLAALGVLLLAGYLGWFLKKHRGMT